MPTYHINLHRENEANSNDCVITFETDTLFFGAVVDAVWEHVNANLEEKEEFSRFEVYYLLAVGVSWRATVSSDARTSFKYMLPVDFLLELNKQIVELDQALSILDIILRPLVLASKQAQPAPLACESHVKPLYYLQGYYEGRRTDLKRRRDAFETYHNDCFERGEALYQKRLDQQNNNEIKND